MSYSCWAPPSRRAPGRPGHARPLVVGFVAVAVLAGLGWLGVAVWYRSTLAAVRAELQAKKYPEARERLLRLAAWWPGRDEVNDPLGGCELELGNVEAAAAAWGRLHPGTDAADTAALRLAAAESDRGRLAEAERVLLRAIATPGPHPRLTDLRHQLLQGYWQQGRFDDVRALTEINWKTHVRERGASSPQAVSNLQAHRALDLEVFPINRVRESLERAGRDAPDDPRVWLGKATLATRSGRLDEARSWLERCLRSAEVDAPVWRVALELAMTTGDPALATRAAAALTESDLTPAELARARAWFAARRGDEKGEAAVWEERLRREPADTMALERLAEIAIHSGDAPRAAVYRKKKEELDRVRREYGNRLSFNATNALELGVMAETLGRRFEARALLALARTLRSDDASLRERYARLEREAAEPRPGSNRRLSELVGTIGPVRPESSQADSGPSPPQFTDDAEPAGLRFGFENGRSPRRQLPETMSGGVGLIDYDGDGFLDVYCVQGGVFPPDPGSPPPGDRLFRNRGDGTFEDVTEPSGIAAMTRGYGHGVAVGDVDNDGRPDLLVTRWRSYALYHNEGGGRFRDATAAWGLGGDRDWPTSAAFADLDGDGDLDLYVCHYITWDANDPRLCGTENGGSPLYCSPHLLPHSVDHLFRNDGGKFTDVSKEAGVTAADRDGRGLGVVAADLDDDGRVDLFVANDGTANFLFRNLGGLKFEETGLTAGVAANAEGGYQAGMGVGCGDLDGDGRLDLVVTNFYGESSSFFQSLGAGLFGERGSSVGLREATRYLLGFGTTMVDANNDGWLDLATANGHVNDVRPVIPYAMPAQLLLGTPGGRGRLVDASPRAGAPWSVPRVGRGLASGDLDNDGRTDLLILDQDGPLAFLHNKGVAGRPPGRFVTLRLEGSASNRDAVGAVVVVKAGGRRQVTQRYGGGSYQSACDPRLHFGLGDSTAVDSVEVRWPSGRRQTFPSLPIDTGVRLKEGEAEPLPLEGFRRPGP